MDGLQDILKSELGTLFLDGSGTTLGLSIEQGFVVLVHSMLSDDNLGRVNANVNINLLTGDVLNADDPLAAIDLEPLTSSSLRTERDHTLYFNQRSMERGTLDGIMK
ncbi:hypothetical protein GYH30_049747 [Glycine max]|nr:hypothetical protein GYH30_049747 [Glycine max]